ncbi:hypothetical protein [Alteriqipengyuania sp.]
MIYDSPDPLWDARRRAETRRRLVVAAGAAALALFLAFVIAAALEWLA